MNSGCVFCKIVENQIPAFKIFESEDILAFLDINPLSQGHSLIIPKNHFEDVFDIPQDILKEIIQAAQKISKIMQKELGAEGVNLFNASRKEAEQSVFHFHLHIIPRYKEDGLKINEWWQLKAKKADLQELEKIAEGLRKSVGNKVY